MNIEYFLKSFDELGGLELYAILALRSAIFVVEQKCAYQEMDGKDLKSEHLLCFVEGRLAGYSRILPAGLSYEEPSIGRVVIDPAFRGYGLGRNLMQNSIVACENLYAAQAIRIGAQYYLKAFYESMGFVQQGEPYDEDGIMHIEMLRLK